MFSSVQDGERQMVESIYGLLEEADAVVHYNGKKFDIPKLNAEFIKFDLTPPSTYKQIDLLTVARSQFRFTSNKLDFVAQHLGIGAKVQHKGMDLWAECMDGDPVAWKQMERYNKQDVRLLPKLYKKLLPWIVNHPNYCLYLDTTRPVCVNCGSTKVQSRGKERTSTQVYPRFRCCDCGKWMRGKGTLLSAEKRANTLVQAR
jgi:DNA polymerase elongation subunit (family B)